MPEAGRGVSLRTVVTTGWTAKTGARARPPFFGLVFWADIAAVVAVRTAHGAGPPLIPLCLALALLVALWHHVSWDFRTSGRRGPLSPLFLSAALVAGMIEGYGTMSPILLIALANVALLYGIGVGAALAALAMAAQLGGMLLISETTLANAALQTVVFAMMAGFVLAVAAAVLEARKQREKAEGFLRELRRHSQRARESAVAEERTRMARDMHDSLGHHLTVIKIGLENAERFRDLRPEAAWEEVRQAKELTHQAYNEARRWVRALRPPALDGRTGEAALRELAMSFDGTGVEVRFAVDGRERPLDQDSELVLYRALQEGLTNVLRHADARQVTTRLTFDAERVALTIGDDGKGASTASLERGFGLSSLAERAEGMGGRLTVESVEGQGLMLRVEVP